MFAKVQTNNYLDPEHIRFQQIFGSIGFHNSLTTIATSRCQLIHPQPHPPLRMPALIPKIRTIHLRLNPLNTPTPIQIRPIRAPNFHILDPNIATHGRTRANKIPNERHILLTSGASEIANRDI